MAFFNYIVSLSIKACILVPFVVAIRFLIDRFPKKYSYALWIFVFISLVVKIDIAGAVDTPISKAQHTIQQQYNSVMASYTEDIVIHHDNTAEYNTAIEQGIQPIISEEAKYVITSAESITPPKTVEKSVMPTVVLVWFVGVMVFMILYIRNIITVLNATKFAVPYKYDIYYSEDIVSPFVFGIIKPKIYLPYTITKEQAEAVIGHERVHIKRLDYMVKPLCYLITALHWFNPFVWLSFYLMTKDMELSCDEAVIKYSDSEDKKEYCNALLQFALKDKSYTIGAVMFGESDCSSRIKNVLNFKQPKKLISLLLVAVVAAVAVVAVTGEKQTAPTENQFAQMTFAQLEEYKPQSDEERLAVIQAMDLKADSEITQYIADEVTAYCEKDSFAKLKDISVNQDHLILSYRQNQKPLCNAQLNITLELYPYTDADIKTKAEQYSRSLYHYLYGGNPDGKAEINLDFVAHKVNGFKVIVLSEKGEHIADYEITVNNSFENPTILEKPTPWVQILPEDEQKALDKAFSFNNQNFTLKKFGIKDSTQLYMEYFIEDDYFHKAEGETEEKIAAQTAALNDVYAQLVEKVVNHSDVKQYIENNSLESAVIAFSHRYLDNETKEFMLVVNDGQPQFTHDIQTEDSLPAAEISFVWPTAENVRVNRGFSGQYPAHDGLDIAGKRGTEIYASADGVVNVSAETDDRYGNYIVILHDNGYRTLYAHCDSLLVETDTTVTQGQLIATMGSTGNSTGNHLHFGISKDFEYINPEEFMTSYLINEDCKNCGGQMMVINDSFGRWYNAGDQFCEHGNVTGMDLIQERGYIKTTLCSECGIGDAELVTETKLKCLG